MFKRMKAVLLVGCFAAAAGMAAPAFAEGSVGPRTYATSVGGATLSWTDNNLDSASTTISHTGCDRASVTMAATRQVTGPDPRYGQKVLRCDRADSLSAGDLPRGTYKAAVLAIGGGGGSIQIRNMEATW